MSSNFYDALFPIYAYLFPVFIILVNFLTSTLFIFLGWRIWSLWYICKKNSPAGLSQNSWWVTSSRRCRQNSDNRRTWVQRGFQILLTQVVAWSNLSLVPLFPVRPRFLNEIYVNLISRNFFFSIHSGPKN